MKKLATVILAIAICTSSIHPAEAHGGYGGYHGGYGGYRNGYGWGIGAGVLGGLALGYGLANPYYGYYPYYPAPVYVQPTYVPAPAYYYPAPQYAQPAPVYVQPQPQTQAYCREYQSNVVINGHVQQSYGQACLQPDGSWKIVN